MTRLCTSYPGSTRPNIRKEERRALVGMDVQGRVATPLLTWLLRPVGYWEGGPVRPRTSRIATNSALLGRLAQVRLGRNRCLRTPHARQAIVCARGARVR
ncbi:hypothetical protein BD310DRAFT_916970 [Dichomitus squalens]|nr:hypothetical protein BD310DRAFT_916970 [Dichomitus squalens]